MIVITISLVYLIVARVHHKSLSDELLDEIVKDTIESYKIPGMTVTVFNSDEILYESSQGFTNTALNTKIDSSQYFHLGSCSKTILSMLSGDYIENGLFEWTTPIIEMDPGLKGIIHESYSGITFEQLLLCQAGIAPYTDGRDMAAIDEMDISSLRDFTYHLLSRESEQSKVSGVYPHLYSNASYSVAAYLLEEVTGKSYQSLIDTYIKEELGLDVINGWPNQLGDYQPWGHVIQNKELIPIDPNHEYRIHPLLLPAGDLSMPAKDYTLMIQEHLKSLTGTDTNLSSETYEYIYNGHKGWSLGVYNEKMLGVNYAGMDGTSGAFYCRGILIPESNLGITIMMNAGSEKATDLITMRIVKSYLGMWWLLI